MKIYISKQRDTIDLQRFSNVIKTHKAKLGVDMNNKDGLIMHLTVFFSFVQILLSLPIILLCR